MKIIEYAKISEIRCPRNIAPCDRLGDIALGIKPEAEVFLYGSRKFLVTFKSVYIV
jgi:hypothetical protein